MITLITSKTPTVLPHFNRDGKNIGYVTMRAGKPTFNSWGSSEYSADELIEIAEALNKINVDTLKAIIDAR